MGRFIEKNIEDVTNLNGSTVWIIDAMALIQCLKNSPPVFDELSVTVLKSVIATATRHSRTRVDFVADQYPDMSVKNAEVKTKRKTSFRYPFKG